MLQNQNVSFLKFVELRIFILQNNNDKKINQKQYKCFICEEFFIDMRNHFEISHGFIQYDRFYFESNERNKIIHRNTKNFIDNIINNINRNIDELQLRYETNRKNYLICLNKHNKGITINTIFLFFIYF